MTMRRKRIAVVGPIYGGSVSVAECAARALDRLGHDVVYVDSTGHKPVLDGIRQGSDPEPVRTRMMGLFLEMVRGQVREATREAGVDVALYLAQAPVLRDEDLDDLRRAGVPTIFWFVEDRTMFGYWRGLVGRYDHFWTFQAGGFVAELKALGQRFADFVPLGADPELHHPIEVDVTYPISFAGTPYPNRVALLRGLADLPGLHLFGPDWSRDDALRSHVAVDGPVPYGELPRLFAASLINLNLSSAVDPAAFAARKDWVNPRAFEICATGGFQLAEALAPIDEFFEPGREVVLFEGAAEARELCARYLADEPARRAIAAAGLRRALADHTYDRRLEAALERAAAVDDRL